MGCCGNRGKSQSKIKDHCQSAKYNNSNSISKIGKTKSAEDLEESKNNKKLEQIISSLYKKNKKIEQEVSEIRKIEQGKEKEYLEKCFYIKHLESEINYYQEQLNNYFGIIPEEYIKIQIEKKELSEKYNQIYTEYLNLYNFYQILYNEKNELQEKLDSLQKTDPREDNFSLE